MRASILRTSFMLFLLAAGSLWLRQTRATPLELSLRFAEVAAGAGCQNRHDGPAVGPVRQHHALARWAPPPLPATTTATASSISTSPSRRGDANRLYRNLGDGTFAEVAPEAGVDHPGGASMHAVWGDVDGDGDLDLYVAKWAAPNTLFENRGDGTFADITAAAGVGHWGYGNGATFLDYDRDGDLDLLVGNYFSAEIEDPATGQMVRNDLWNPVSTRVMHETFTHAANGGKNVFYENRGGGRFVDVTGQVGLRFNGWTLAVGSADLNNDGWPDLYLANDFGPDELYLSTGATEQPPRFRAVIDAEGHPGVGADWWKGMNVDFGDVNGDGYFDIYVTNILAHRYKTDEGNMLWLNLPDASAPGGRGFRNVGPESGTDDGGWGWGAAFGDFDLDGRLDIFEVNGFVTGDPDTPTGTGSGDGDQTRTRPPTPPTSAMGDRDLRLRAEPALPQRPGDAADGISVRRRRGRGGIDDCGTGATSPFSISARDDLTFTWPTRALTASTGTTCVPPRHRCPPPRLPLRRRRARPPPRRARRRRARRRPCTGWGSL
jgi:hypothetical protein